LLYGDCHIALDRKLSQAQKMNRFLRSSHNHPCHTQGSEMDECIRRGRNSWFCPSLS
jgi:hypothetical protein